MTTLNHYDNDWSQDETTEFGWPNSKIEIVRQYLPDKNELLGNVTAILGLQQSGCSTLFKHLYEQICNETDEVYVYSGCKETCYSMANKSNIFYDLDSFPSLADKICKEMNNNIVNRVLIFDSLGQMYNNLTKYVSKYTEIFMLSKYKKLSIFIIANSPFEIGPMLRSQISNLFILNGFNKYGQLNKIRDYVNNWPQFKILYGSLDKYSMLAINNKKGKSINHYKVPSDCIDLNFISKGPYELTYKADYNNVINTVNLIIGKKGVGKSKLMEDLYSYIHHKIDEFYVLTQLNEDSYPMTDRNHISCDFNELEILINKCKNKPKLNKVLLIDEMDMEILGKNINFQHLMMNSRPLGVTIFIISQYLPYFKPNIRVNIDKLFVMRNVIFETNPKRFELYIGNQLHIFSNMYKQLVDYDCLLIDNGKNNEILKYTATYPLTHTYKTISHNNDLISSIDESLENLSLKKINVNDIKELRVQLKQLKSLCSKLLDNTNF